MNQASPLVGAPLGRTMLRMAIPGVIGALLFSILGLVEAANLKHSGADALAAVAVVFPLIMLSAMFSAGAFGGAVSGRTARAIGAGDENEARAVLVCSVLISLVGGVLMWILVASIGPTLFVRATDNPSVAQAAIRYSTILFPAIPAFWLVNMLSSVLRGCGDMVRPALIAGSMLLSYVLLAALLIPIAESNLDKTIQAAGSAMAGAYLSSLVLTIFFIQQKRQPIRFQISAFRWHTLLGILRQGLLAGSQSLMTVCYALVTTVLFSRFGTDWLAGYGLAVRLELIMVPVIFGIGASIIAIVGAYVGAGQRQRAISIAWRGILINAVLVGCVGVLISLFPGLWCNVVGSDPAVISHCSQSLRFIAPTYAFFALGLGGYFASQALNTLKFPVLGSLLRLSIVATGLIWVSEDTSVNATLLSVAFAVLAYGLLVAGGLKLVAWRR